ncbi:MAG: hypothetical protein FWB89_07045 [Treponema sp.]|nr:hypothetical protein [Treponema sp.]
MKKSVMLFLFFTAIIGIGFAEETAENGEQVESRIDLSFYASTRGEMQVNFIPQWKFPFLQGNTPWTSENNVVLKLDAALSPIWAGFSTDAIFTVLPFLLIRSGAMAGTGWNYDLFGKVPLVGLGLNRRTDVNDPNDGVTGNGFDGVVWNVHAGLTIQFNLAAFFPGDWNHVVMQFYNRVEYFAYTKAKGRDLWYYLGDDGMNMNVFRRKFELFVGYVMPIFINLIGYQLEGTLPFYNIEAGSYVADMGYSLTNAFIANFRINRQFSIMTIARITNGFKDPITNDYEREWGFDRVQFIATWRIK